MYVIYLKYGDKNEYKLINYGWFIIMVVGQKFLLSNILAKITVHEVANTVKQPVQRDDVAFSFIMKRDLTKNYGW